MLTRRHFFRNTAALAAATALSEAASAQTGSKKAADAFAGLAHRTDDPKASAVYFVPGVGDDSVIKAYRALRWTPKGKTAVKVSFEGPGGPYVNPESLRSLIKEVSGTFADTNGMSAPRNNTADHLKLAAEHGFAKVGPIDILDDAGGTDLPVPNGFHLKRHIVGSHFTRYGSFVSVVKYKMHHLPRLGGTLKNLSITLATISGKYNIHSAGATSSSWQSADNDTTAEAMTDAVKAAMAARPWCFISVMSSFAPDDGCEGAKNLGDVGVFASLDPVALDQVCTDITLAAAPSDEVRAVWAEKHSLNILEKAEKNGVGRRNYRLVML